MEERWEVTIEDHDTEDQWYAELVWATGATEARQRALTAIGERHPETRGHQLVITKVRVVWTPRPSDKA